MFSTHCRKNCAFKVFGAKFEMVEGLTDGAECSLPAVDAAALERGLAEPVHAAGQRNTDVTVSTFPGDKGLQTS